MCLLKKCKKGLTPFLVLSAILVPTISHADSVDLNNAQQNTIVQEVPQNVDQNIDQNVDQVDYLSDLEDNSNERVARARNEVWDLSRKPHNFVFDIRYRVDGRTDLRPDGSSMRFDFSIDKGASNNDLNKDIQVILYKDGRQVDRRTVNFVYQSTTDRHYCIFRDLDSRSVYSYEIRKADDGVLFSGSCTVE